MNILVTILRLKNSSINLKKNPKPKLLHRTVKLLRFSHLIQQQYFWLHTKSAKICARICHIGLINPDTFVSHSSYRSCTTDEQYSKITAVPAGLYHHGEHNTRTRAIVEPVSSFILHACTQANQSSSPLPIPEKNVYVAKIPQPREKDA